MVTRAVAQNTIDTDTGIDNPQGIMPCIIRGMLTSYRGTKYKGAPVQPLCRVDRNDPGMQWSRGTHSLAVVKLFGLMGIEPKGVIINK